MTGGGEESALIGAIDIGVEVASSRAPIAPANLYRLHVDSVARWVAHLAGPSAEVDDLVQEVFIIALRRLHEFRGDAKITTWLYRIARNVVRNHRRKARVLRWLGIPGQEVSAEIESDALTPIEELERSRREVLVYRVLDSMSERHRALLILFELEGRSGTEIAEIMGVKVGTVWVQLHRARAAFLQRLQTVEKEGGR